MNDEQRNQQNLFVETFHIFPNMHVVCREKTLPKNKLIVLFKSWKETSSYFWWFVCRSYFERNILLLLCGPSYVFRKLFDLSKYRDFLLYTLLCMVLLIPFLFPNMSRYSGSFTQIFDMEKTLFQSRQVNDTKYGIICVICSSLNELQ